MTVIILAGGKSRRMGYSDKAFLEIGNEPLIKRQIRLLKKHFKKIIIVTNKRNRYNGFKGIRVILDVVAHGGPLAGILSGLMVSKDRYNFVVACDMPFINPRLIKYMYRNSDGYDVVVPWIKNRYEPLFCIYSKDCAGQIKSLLRKKIFKISRLFSRMKVRKVSRQEISGFGRFENIFMNINTPVDFRKLHG